MVTLAMGGVGREMNWSGLIFLAGFGGVWGCSSGERHVAEYPAGKASSPGAVAPRSQTGDSAVSNAATRPRSGENQDASGTASARSVARPAPSRPVPPRAAVRKGPRKGLRDPWKGAGWWPEVSWARRPKLLWKRRGLVLLAGQGAQGVFCKDGKGLWVSALKRPTRGKMLVGMKRRPPRALWWLSAGLLSGAVIAGGQGRCSVTANPAGDPDEQELVWGEMKQSRGLLQVSSLTGGPLAWKRSWSTSGAHRCLDAAWPAGPGRVFVMSHEPHWAWSNLGMADVRTGRSLWGFGGTSRLARPWSDGTTVVTAVKETKKILGLDFATGKQVWTAPWDGGEPAGFCPLSGTVVEDPMSLKKVDLTTGKVTEGLVCQDGHRVKWRLQDMVHVCGGGKVFGMLQETGSTDMEVGAMDLDAGQVLWHKDLCREQTAVTMALSRDALLLVCRAPVGDRFRLFALAPDDGRELWTMALDRNRGNLWPAESCLPAGGPAGIAVVGSVVFVAGAEQGFLLDFGKRAASSRKAYVK